MSILPPSGVRFSQTILCSLLGQRSQPEQLMALAVGSRLGHYDVTALIGEGGMGQVYQATDTKLNRQVALKILL